MDCCFRAATARARLDRRAHRRDPLSLGGGTHRTLGRTGRRIGPAQGGRHRHWWKCGARGKAGLMVVPIVFAVVDDPVGMGLVASLARPGGNVTGLSIQSTVLAGKRIELL